MPKRRRGYATELTDAQWAVIAELVPDALPGGRPRRATSRELVNAILYTLRGGQAWRLLPHDFPPWQTVYYYLRRWQAEGVWERIHRAVLTADRERAGREATLRWLSIGFADGTFASSAPRPPSSTASRCGWAIKRGLARPRRGQEDRRPQAAYPDRYR